MDLSDAGQDQVRETTNYTDYGDRVDSAKMEQLQKYLYSVDQHLGLRTEHDQKGNLAIIIVVRE